MARIAEDFGMKNLVRERIYGGVFPAEKLVSATEGPPSPLFPSPFVTVTGKFAFNEVTALRPWHACIAFYFLNGTGNTNKIRGARRKFTPTVPLPQGKDEKVGAILKFQNPPLSRAMQRSLKDFQTGILDTINPLHYKWLSRSSPT